MPFTAFHAAPVWLLFLAKPKRFDWIALSCGATLPDILEPLMIFVFTGYYWDVRVVTHSLLGAVTVLLLAAVLISISILPHIIRFFKERFSDRRFHTFAGIDILEKRSFGVIIYSALIGTVSHITLDLFYHERNPIFYPFGDAAILFFNDIIISKTITSIITGGIFCYLAYRFWWKI
ncbi:MAG: DUF4184 family protein [Thermoplasmata archaeon]|nr:MAG: DUF4184 family protein [Thermoplasmata archaeon]